MSDSNKSRDRALGMSCPITRRDFLNGVAVGAGGLLASGWMPELLRAAENDLSAQDRPGYYPPALTGMRGSHPGSFETAHDVRDKTYNPGSPVDTGEKYDLVVVGGGISGLAAAYFHRKQAGSKARILILDNHDDFGGHAKRNEFRPAGHLRLANGGTVAIESPFAYSPEARGLLTELGIDPPALEAKCTDRTAYKGLKSAYFFDKETFGTEKLVAGTPGPNSEAKDWADYLTKTPLSADAQGGIVRIQTEKTDYLPGLSQVEKKEKLSRMSYRDFLLNVVKVSPDAAAIYQTRTHGLYGIGIDAVPALDCWAIHFPGFEGLGLDRVAGGRLSFTALGEVTPSQTYHFHFPDGNASIARMLVRSLIPASAPGHRPEDIVTAKIDYASLDKKDSQVRIRLNSTAVKVQHVGDAASAKEVEVTYGRDSKSYTARANSVVLACWNMVIPYICAELPAKQKQALKYGVKVPLVYTVVSIKSWTSFQKLGISRVSSPGMYHSSVGLDQSTNIGDYTSPKTSDEPILVRMLRTPCQPGLPAREQQKIGRYDLLATDFETFERNIRDQLARILSAGGFDPARDIDAITVNRWPHGYAYEYNPLWDPDWPVGQRPCDIARQRFGRIAIANSDAAAAAYTDQAIDQAFRAVRELQST